MNGLDEVKLTPTTCRNHSSRTDRECFRTCPSKLSKKELEDIYFTLLDNNIKLKRSLNSQDETIKLLSTKVHRMTVLQQNILRDPKDCCAHTKALVKDHKESIENLKIVNERMSERIRMLTMRLCSAKQLSRRSTVPMSCAKCFAPLSGKNSSVSMIHTKRSEVFRSRALSSNCLERNSLTKTVDTQTDLDEETNVKNPETLCNENKCSNLKEELELRINDLQQELAKAHETYSNRISFLDKAIANLNSDNQRLHAECVTHEFEVRQSGQVSDELSNKLRAAEVRSGELAIQLSVEKRKVSELETRLRVVDTTHALAKAIEDQLSENNKCNYQPNTPPEGTSVLYHSQRWHKTSTQLEVPCTSGNSDVMSPKGENKPFDDSGYADQTQDDDCHMDLQLSNKALMEKISLLQNQFSALETSADKIHYEAQDQIEEQPAECAMGSYSFTSKNHSHIQDNQQSFIEETTGADKKSFKEDEKLLEVDSDPDSDISNRSYTIKTHNRPTTSKDAVKKEINDKMVVAKFKQLIKSKENISKQGSSEDITIKCADTFDNTVKHRQLIKSKQSKHITASEIKSRLRANNLTNKLDKMKNNAYNADLYTDLKMAGNKNAPASTDEAEKEELSVAVVEDKCVKHASRLDTQISSHRKPTRAPSFVNRRRSLTYNKDTSPDNTDNEISSMTDLPCEKERVTSEDWSPGEERPTTTYSESYSDHDYGSLSEGELPLLGKDQTMSNGETRQGIAHFRSRGVPGMQDTLQAIDDELKRCQRLLRTQPPQEQLQREQREMQAVS